MQSHSRKLKTKNLNMDDRDFSNPSTHRQQFSLVRGCLRFQVYTLVYIYICTSLTGSIPNIFVVENWNHPLFETNILSLQVPPGRLTAGT